MGFSVPLNFHKAEADCHIIQFSSLLEGESLYLASVVFSPLKDGKRELLFEKGEYIFERTAFDLTGELSALISALMLCLEQNIDTIFIEGMCDKIRTESGEFVNSLFEQFTYVYFKGELKDKTNINTVLNKVLDSKSLHFVSFKTS